jgi:uridine kinase
VVYLHAAEDVATERGVARDAAAMGGEAAARAAYEARYQAACRIYLAEHNPRVLATIVVDNTDPEHPVIK